jgi:hypothetical protein
MENASNALIIAGTLLIAIAIIATGVIIINSGSATAQDFDEKQALILQNRYLAQFEKYNSEKIDGQYKPEINILDVRTLVNLAEDYIADGGEATVTLNGAYILKGDNKEFNIRKEEDYWKGETEKNYYNVAKNEEIKKYKCEVKINLYEKSAILRSIDVKLTTL